MSISVTCFSIDPETVVGRAYVSMNDAKLVIYIDNADHTDCVMLEGGISITDSLGNIKGLVLSLKWWNFLLYTGYDVKILDVENSVLLFAGTIKEITKKFPGYNWKTAELMVQDYSVILDLIIDGVNLSSITTEYVALNYLIDLHTPDILVSPEYILYDDAVTLAIVDKGMREAVNEVAVTHERKWYVDYEKYLHYYSIGDEIAPFNVSDNPDLVTTFPFMDLEITEDSADPLVVRGSFKCWKPGLRSGQVIEVTHDFAFTAFEVLIYEVSSKLITGSAYESPVFEYTVSFGTRPKRITERIGAEVTEGGETEVLNKTASSTTANWYSGTATSGLTGADLVVIGTDGTNKKLYALWINTKNLTDYANIVVRMYQDINGTESKIYDQTFVVKDDPQTIWVISGDAVITGAVRVEFQSAGASDNAKEIDYEYVTS